jgi:hypothetical protein
MVGNAWWELRELPSPLQRESFIGFSGMRMRCACF